MFSSHIHAPAALPRSKTPPPPPQSQSGSIKETKNILLLPGIERSPNEQLYQNSCSSTQFTTKHKFWLNLHIWCLNFDTEKTFPKTFWATLNGDILDFKRSPCSKCCILFGGNSQASEVYMPTFRNTPFHLHRQVGVPAYEDGTDSVPKRRHINFRRRGITQKKAYNKGDIPWWCKYIQ
jgi:hypothetical protein